MKTKRLISTIVATPFLISLFLCSTIAYVKTDALTETRKSSLVRTLSRAQIEDLGAFHNFFGPYIGGFWAEQHFVNEIITADALRILKTLNASSNVNVDQAIEYIACKQYRMGTGIGGFGAYFEVDGAFQGCNLYSTYEVVRCLKAFNSLDRINQTMLIDFITRRYNDTIGAFHELITVVDGKEYAHGGFPLVFRSFMSHIAYAIPNIITTYAGICALKELDRLDLINTTKAFGWIMHCQAENGMFRPYPDASYMPLPEWSPFKTNPFEVDRYGTGIPYTFAAVCALEALGRLDAITVETRQKIKNYIPSCQINRTDMSGLIYIHQDYDYPHPAYTYEALMTLYYLDMLDKAKDVVTKIVDFFQRIQILHLDESWPIPYPGDYYDEHTAERYGLHRYEGAPIDSLYAVAVFNATGNMHLLDQPTPRVQRTWLNLVELSAVITTLATGTVIFILKIRKRGSKAENIELPPTVKTT